MAMYTLCNDEDIFSGFQLFTNIPIIVNNLRFIYYFGFMEKLPKVNKINANNTVRRCLRSSCNNYICRNLDVF